MTERGDNGGKDEKGGVFYRDAQDKVIPGTLENAGGGDRCICSGGGDNLTCWQRAVSDGLDAEPGRAGRNEP